MAKSEAILAYLHAHYAGAKTALVFASPFECLVAVSLSAQATDRSVNLATASLFAHFPTAEAMAEAPIRQIEKDIHSIGIYHNKAKHISALSQEIVGRFHGVVPLTEKELVTLPGVGTKTARVFLLEILGKPAIPVDTHIARIASRLRYAKISDSPTTIEKKLERSFPEKEWIFLHHALIEFGRKECHAQNPACEACPFVSYCCFKKKASKIGK